MYCKLKIRGSITRSGMDPDVSDPETRGICQCCGEELREDYTYFSDNEGNTYCSKDCAAEYHGIVETEW